MSKAASSVACRQTRHDHFHQADSPFEELQRLSFMPVLTAKSRRARQADADAESFQAENLSHTRREHASETAEDYVEAIADLTMQTGEARVVELARKLGVTHVTVNRTVVRLQKAGYVTAQPYRAIFLTDAGRKLAELCKMKHHTVVEFLCSLGVPRRVAEMDAEGIEHHVSPTTLAAFRNALGKSKRDSAA